MVRRELYHHGIKGMKWGVRRYQNKDGSLTERGKRRMYAEMFDNESKESKERKRYTAEPHKWVENDMRAGKRLADEGSNMTNRIKQLDNINQRHKKQNQARMNLSEMSDQELRNQINRELLERQYNDVFNPPTVSKGREYVGQMLEVAGGVLGVTSSALGIALAIKELRG